MDKNQARSPLTYPFSCIDTFRIFILQVSLKNPILKTIFLTRAYRLLGFFAFSLIFNFVMSLYFPLWILLLGPLVLGVPHLLSTIRYIPKFTLKNVSLSTQQVYMSVSSLFIVMALIRLWTGSNPTSWLMDYPNLPELIGGLLIVLVFATWSHRNRLKTIFAGFIFAVLVYFSWQHPLETVGALVLIHNFYV